MLEYLRNEKVYLPVAVSKEAVLSELEYYCVSDVKEEANYSSSECAQIVQTMKDTETHVKDFDAISGSFQ